MAVWARIRHQLARWLIGRFQVPRDAVRWACRRHAQRTALVTASGRWTFRQLHERSLRLAQALLAQGAGAEAVVLCQVSDDHELLEIRLACFECGAASLCLPDFADAAAVLAVLAAVAPTVVVTSPGMPLATATLPAGVRRVLTGSDYEQWLLSQPADLAAVPVTPQVRAASELLGIDPVHVANEGKAVIGVRPDAAENVLEALRAHPLGRDAAIVGTCTNERIGAIVLDTGFGRRLVTEPEGELLPRIC